jgi:hypothetical protein
MRLTSILLIKGVERWHFLCPSHYVARRASSSLEPGDAVEVVKMAPEEECEQELFKLIRWKPHPLAVPLMQAEGL